MKRLIFVFALAVLASEAFAQLGDPFRLPGTWTKDFTITLAYHGSMSGSYTDVRFTYDSAIYKGSSNHDKPVLRVYLLKESDRAEILKKLHELRADEIRSKSGTYVVNDGWSQSICYNSFHCVDGGTSAEMSEEDKNRFEAVYRYLEEWAMKKRR